MADSGTLRFRDEDAVRRYVDAELKAALMACGSGRWPIPPHAPGSWAARRMPDGLMWEIAPEELLDAAARSATSDTWMTMRSSRWWYYYELYVQSQAIYMTHSGYESPEDPERYRKPALVWYNGAQPLREFIVEVMDSFPPNLSDYS